MTDKKTKYSKTHPIIQAVKNAYRAGQEDEALEPIVLVDENNRPVGRISNNDVVIFYDIRGEREIELTRSLTDSRFTAFETEKDMDLRFVTMIQYHPDLKVKVAFPPEGRVEKCLAEVVTTAGEKIVKVSESEKAVHVGYFMNGKREEPFDGEERITVPSPEVDNYAETPEMSAEKVVDEVRRQAGRKDVRLIVANLANVDVIGHIEDRQAVLRAVEHVDRALGNIEQICRKNGLTLIITADHGTVEEWLYEDGTVNTGHTSHPVPFILTDFSDGPSFRIAAEGGDLCDVAPTVLFLLGLNPSKLMTGKNLILNQAAAKKKRRVLLLILDGWGHREDSYGNMITASNTEHFDRLWEEYPHTLLKASGEVVGMPTGTVGNSESGHLHLGAGRRIPLDRVKIDRAVKDGSFYSNEVLKDAVEGAMQEKSALHLLGIVSHYSSHGTIRHLFALLDLAQRAGLRQVYVHSLIGRRGEKPESGAVYVEKVIQKCRELKLGEVVTVMGRFWALDREENWNRVRKAYRALVFGEGTPAG